MAGADLLTKERERERYSEVIELVIPVNKTCPGMKGLRLVQALGPDNTSRGPETRHLV